MIGVFGWIFITLQNSEASLGELLSGILSEQEGRISLQRAGRLMEDKKDDIQRVDNFLVARANPVNFIESLEDLARQTQNKIVIDLDEAKSQANKHLVFRLTVDGTQKSALKYSELLEFLPYQISVQELSFQKISPAKGVSGARIIILIEVNTR